MKLASLAGQIPYSHIISAGLKADMDTPYAAGGFADIYRGTLQGKQVALKVVRVYGTRNIQVAQKARASVIVARCI